MTFILGGFWRICERCGKKVRNYDTAKEWDGLIVCINGCFEERQSQDYVRGVKDNQNVPDPRPEPALSFIGPLITKISTAANAGVSTIQVDSSVRFLAADHIGVMLASGNIQTTIIQSIPNTTSILLANPLRESVAVGNVVTNYSVISEPDIG